MKEEEGKGLGSSSYSSSDLETDEVVIQARGPIRSGVRRVVMSPNFQSYMSLLVVLYIAVTIFEMILAFSKKNNSEEKFWTSVANSLTIFNGSIMCFFMLETLVRAGMHKRGMLGYFSSFWNVLDMMVIAGSCVLEVVAYLLGLELSYASVLIVTIRLLSSLRTIHVLYRSFISTEAHLNHNAKSSVRRLLRKCDSLDSDNHRLRQELSEKQVSIQKMESEIISINQHLLTAQHQSWDRLVPSLLNLGISGHKTKPSTRTNTWV